VSARVQHASEGSAESQNFDLRYGFLTFSLSGRPPLQIARYARTIVPARMARLLRSHGRSKRWLDGISIGYASSFTTK
jgi:hypothetical protein